MPRIDATSAFIRCTQAIWFGPIRLDLPPRLAKTMRAVKAIRQRPRGPKRSTIYDCQEWADLCDEADFWHRRFLEVEAAYYAIRGNVAERCDAVDIHVHSPRVQAVPHEEIVRTVEESHVKKVELYKEEVEKHHRKYEAALKEGAACKIEVWWLAC